MFTISAFARCFDWYDKHPLLFPSRKCSGVCHIFRCFWMCPLFRHTDLPALLGSFQDQPDRSTRTAAAFKPRFGCPAENPGPNMKWQVAPHARSKIEMLREIPRGIPAISGAANGVWRHIDHLGNVVHGQKRRRHGGGHTRWDRVDTPHAPPDIRKIIAVTRQHPASQRDHAMVHSRH